MAQQVVPYTEGEPILSVLASLDLSAVYESHDQAHECHTDKVTHLTRLPC
jgi:hypothetical protein